MPEEVANRRRQQWEKAAKKGRAPSAEYLELLGWSLFVTNCSGGAVEFARAAVNDRADLPGMSLMEHLEELRRRIIRSAVFIVVAFFIAYAFHAKIYHFMEAPIVTALKAHNLDTQLVYHNPIDPFNLYLKISFVGGAILASPFVLYQVWMFISPGLYQNEKKYVVPFMSATVGLFLAGAFFGYKLVYPHALEFLIGYSSDFKPLIEINEYTDLFMTVILGLGLTFELPIRPAIIIRIHRRRSAMLS